MSARLKGRRREVERVVADATQWAEDDKHVVALALVGSYARGAERLGSDVDLMVLFVEAYLDDFAQIDAFQTIRPAGRLVRVQRWGAVLEQRYRLPSGLQVEFNSADQNWAAIPLDPGTARVLGDGYRPLYDPVGILARAVASLD